MEIAERISPFTPEWIQGAGVHLSRYRFACNYIKNKKVLDVGCGVGYGSYMMAEAGAKTVLGIDLNQQCIDRAQAEFKRDNLRFIVDDAQVFKQTEKFKPFDTIVSFENIEHLPHPEDFMQKSTLLLESDGKLVISTPDTRYTRKDKDGKLLNKYHKSEMTQAQFSELIEKYYQTLKIFYQTVSLEGLRAQRLKYIVNHFSGSKTFKLENVIRRLFRKAPLETDLFISAESDFEIVSKPLYELHIYALVAVASKIKTDYV